MKRRILALLVVTVMLVGLMPAMSGVATNAFAPSSDGDSTKMLNGDTGWAIGSLSGNNYAKINTAYSYTGSGSMHLVSYAGASDWNVRIHPNHKPDLEVKKDVQYKVSFWAKVNDNDANSAINGTQDAVRFCFGSWTMKSLSDLAVGEPDANGWQYYEKEYIYQDSGNGTVWKENGTGNKYEASQWGFYIGGGNVDVYIDDISVQIQTNGVYGDNILTHNNASLAETYKKMAQFDTDSEIDDWAIKHSLTRKADGAKVSDITADLSGATLKVSTTAINGTENADSCQLIVALYNGTTMEKVVLSDSPQNVAAGGRAYLQAEITLPTITAETAANYTIKLFVWDSYAGMDPLCISTSI